MKKRNHSFRFDGAQFANQWREGGIIEFKSIEAAKKAKEKSRMKFWTWFLIIAFIMAMLIVLFRAPAPPGPTEEEKARMEYVKEQMGK